MTHDDDTARKRISDQFKRLNTDGVQNGGITKFRIIASGVIGLVTVIGGVFLLYHQIAVPDLFWYISIGALSGVVGLDLLTSAIKAVRK
jgi:hypothetical protein